MRESILVTFICQNEMYAIKRQNSLPIFPGYHSFPGGKVDKEDHLDDWPNLYPQTAKHPKHLMNAMRRELIEEVAVDIDLLIKNNDVIELNAVGVAITPDFNPYRFKNYYYVIVIKNRPVIKIEDREIEYGEWKSPKEYLVSYKNNKMLIVPPMLKMIEAMDRGEMSTQHDFELTYDKVHEVPMIESLFGVKQFLPLSNTFPPANRTNCFLIGDQKKVCIDPSPCNLEEYRKLKNSLQKYGVDFIMLTHHHPDHHEYAPNLARDFAVGIGLSLDSKQRIEQKWGSDYFKNIPLTILSEGMVLTESNNRDVVLYAVPGHDEGQLALAPRDLSWFIVGDLIQSVGTVVIGAPEGDMKKYFDSLLRVINLNPLHIIPSHGIALGGVFKLCETLKHRLMRETQIKKMKSENKSNQEILIELYKDLAPELHKYALKTIEAHLKKIDAEN